MHYFLYTWTPYFRGFNLMSDDPETGEYGAPCIQTADPYTLKTSFSPILGLHEAVEQNQDKPAVIRGLSRYAHLYQSLSRYFLAGDLYTLTEPHKDPKRWTVWQFDHPESGDGLLQCIRQSQCQDEDIRVYPHVPGEGDWRFENPETGESFVLTADELRRGMRFTQPRRSVAFWRYAKA
jgi:hypothetical protein